MNRYGIVEIANFQQWADEILVTDAHFFDESNADRLARWLRRHTGQQVSKDGAWVRTYGIPRSIMNRGYGAIGATPDYERIR